MYFRSLLILGVDDFICKEMTVYTGLDLIIPTYKSIFKYLTGIVFFLSILDVSAHRLNLWHGK